MDQENKYMVCVRCFTYNHAPYIEDALRGFCTQETNFPFVCTIVDDASTDGEQEVIKQFLSEQFDAPYRTEETNDYQLICAQHKSNANCTFAVFFLKYNHYRIRKSKVFYLSEWQDNADYIALCEGDDYWTIPSKLQRQVSFLENNPGYSMCFHRANVLLQQDSRQMIGNQENLESRDYTGDELYKNWIVPTASIMYTAKVDLVRDSRFLYGDIVLILSCAMMGKIHCINESMSVYRRHVGGVSYRKPEYKKWISHHMALREHFPNYKKTIDNYIAGIFVDYFFAEGLDRISFEVIKDMIKYPRYLIPVVLSLPRFIINHLKSRTKKSNMTIN